MTEKELRQNYLNVLRGWIGLSRAAQTHRPIIDAYNSHSPKARSYTLTYQDDYCAGTVSAAAIVAGLTEIYPLEVGVDEMRKLAVARGIWVEDDAYIPQPGDLIIYDWEDSGIGDNAGYPDHVGAVEACDGRGITVIEGNASGGVVRRLSRTVDQIYIRGYIAPDYSRLATPETPSDVTVSDAYYYRVGSVPAVYRPTVDKLVERGILRGRGGSGEDRVIDLSEEAVRVLVLLDRAGVFGGEA